MASDSENDIEKKLQPELAVTAVDSEPVKPRGCFAKIRYYEEVLDRKLGIESHSLDRVHPENRSSPSPLVMAFMWASATMNISCFSTGFLGNEFGLSLGETIPIVVFATLLGAAVTVRIPFPGALKCCVERKTRVAEDLRNCVI
jgi:hypothetical protein